MALNRRGGVLGKSKKGIMFTLLTIILFVLMLAEVITYVVINNTYNQQASEASAVIGASSLSSTLKGSLVQFLKSSMGQAVKVYMPANSILQYPLYSTTAGALSSLMYNGVIAGTSYSDMGNATVLDFVNAIEKQASAQSSSMVIYNSSVTLYQDSPEYINISYTGMAAINTTYGSFVYPLSVDVGYPTMLSYVNITLQNAQSSPTPAPFQQMVTFDPSSYSEYEGSDLGNIRFYHGSAPIYSWCESGCSSTSTSAVFWVSLPGGIAADSNTVVTMGFLPKNTEYSMAYQSGSVGAYAGEAPQLSSTYAKYDNGASVFNFYDDFKGTSLNTDKWTSGGAFTVDNGISITPAQNGHVGTVSTFGNPMVADMYAEFTGTGSSAGGVLSGMWFSSSSNGGTYFVGWHSAADHFTGGEWNPSQDWPAFPTSPSADTYYVWTVNWGPGSYGNIYYDYGNLVVPTDYSDTTAVNLELQTQSNAVATLYDYWVRIRAWPPNNVMPAVALGNLIRTT